MKGSCAHTWTEATLATLSASVGLSLEPSAAFSILFDELAGVLARLGLQLESGPAGRVVERGVEVGRVRSWEPGKYILIEWHQADWKPEETTKVEVRFEPVKHGTRVTVEHHEWGGLLSDQGGELAGWFAGEVVAPLFQATAPIRFGDWLTDRLARRPSGMLSRDGYRDPTHHRPNFLAILSALRLKSDDYLLEIGCGGGAFLQNALASGCKAAGLDHSPDMVKVAIDLNQEAVSEGRLKVVQGEANQLPYPDRTFTCAVMTNVFGFLADPIGVLTEIRRVVSSHGRIAVFTLSSEMKGTIAAPEPMASRLHFYTDKELTEMAEKAGFVKIRVEHPDLEPFAREAKLPEDVVADFRGEAHDQLLLAWKK